MSPLSNVVVAGIVDPGRGSACIVSEAKPNKTSAPKSFVRVVFVTVDRAALAGINDPGYRRAQAVAVISGSARRAPIRSSK